MPWGFHLRVAAGASMLIQRGLERGCVFSFFFLSSFLTYLPVLCNTNAQIYLATRFQVRFWRLGGLLGWLVPGYSTFSDGLRTHQVEEHPLFNIRAYLEGREDFLARSSLGFVFFFTHFVYYWANAWLPCGILRNERQK
jgi:hypothetical protein